MTIHYKLINPTSSDNISSGNALNDIWVNLVTYSRYEMLYDGVWTYTAVDNGKLVIPNEIQSKMN